MSERLRILELIEAGEINVEEGARRLEALAGGAKTPYIPAPRPRLVRWLWQAALGIGIAMLAWGGLLLARDYAGEAATGRAVWGWLLFALGLTWVVLGWWLQRTRWFSLRVRRAGGHNISFALPLPLGPVAWVLRIARPFVPQLAETGVDELILAMREELRDGRSFAVEVDEGEDGEQVQVYFG